jgi:sugar/nucleoside kinase (ribokinase family)
MEYMSDCLDVLGIGIAAVDDLIYVAEYPSVDCKVPILGRARQGGGPACTAIAAVGSLGGRAAYVARFGDNELSTFIKSALLHHNTDVSHIVKDTSGGPYHSTILVDGLGHRNVFYDATLYRPVVPENLPFSLIQSARVVLLDHITEPSLVPVAEKARSLGVRVLGDIEGCTESSRQLAMLTDYLIVPRAWALWATGTSDALEACKVLAHTERRATIVTDSARGCYCISECDSTVRHFPAFKVDVFDSNGCGDTFHGAFALAVARGLTVEQAIPFASAAAALKAVAAGGDNRGWDALPTLDEVLRFLEARLTELDGVLLLREIQSRMAAIPRK